jgi:hypothetical protein
MESKPMNNMKQEVAVRSWRMVRLLVPAAFLVWRSQTYTDPVADSHFYIAPVMTSFAAVFLLVTGFAWSLQPVEPESAE